MFSYFTLKALFILKIFKFLVFKFSAQLERQGYFKIYDVATWLTNNCNTHLRNISRSRGRPQTMKFGQLIKYNMKNNYHTQNVVEKLFPDTTLKIQDLAYLWIKSLKFYTVCFHCMSN